MNKQELLNALTNIGLALNASHNTVTTDIVGVEPNDTSWRIDNSKEIALLSEIEVALNTGICLGCGGHNKCL